MAIAPSACASQRSAPAAVSTVSINSIGDVGESLEQLLERRSALREGLLEQHLILAREQVEGDVGGGRLEREPLDPRGRRMDPLAERVEVLAAVAVAHDDLAVEHVAARGERELGEVAPERLAVARLQEHLIAVDEREAAEAVELDLVAVVLTARQLLAR